MQAETGRTLLVDLEEPGPRLWKAQQTQGMSGWRCIENNMIVIGLVLSEESREFVERCNLGRASTR